MAGKNQAALAVYAQTKVIFPFNKLSPSYIQDLVNEKVSRYNFRNKKQVEIPQVNSKRYGMKSFRFEAARCGTASPMNSEWLRTTSNSGGCCGPGMV